MEPAAIQILETQETEFIIKGELDVSPMCDVESVSYPGLVRGKGRELVESIGALQQAVAKHKSEFRESPDWIEDVTKEIKTHETQGWGMENAKVTLPEKSAIYAASVLCPSCGGGKMLTCTQCNGQGQMTCAQCQGQGRETCYHCGGRGENPQQPGQRCTTCNGTRFAVCRFCQGRRYLACPTCNGQRGTPCTTCQGTGRITHEATVTCGAETHFRLKAEGLPSGLRRGLERIGLANLHKGHADVTAQMPPEEKGAKEKGGEPPKEGAPVPILHYEVKLPYAELRMDFGNKKAVVSVVGKRCAISGVPNFLDDALNPWIEKLRVAATHTGNLNEAIEVRALKEILSLTVAGKDRTDEVRKLYPFGLSAQTIDGILSDMRLALNRATLKTRATMAIGCVVASALIAYIIFMQGIEARITMGWKWYIGLALDIALTGAMMAASWALLNFSTRFVLQRRFPQLKLALKQKIGKTGRSMLAAIVTVFLVTMFFATIRPLWLALLIH